VTSTLTLSTLPVTGTPLVPLIVAGVVLLLAGAVLLFWQ
jgi:LPXTG-motif cell wall-anchored protein